MPERASGSDGGAMDRSAVRVRGQDDAMGRARAARVSMCARIVALTRGSVMVAPGILPLATFLHPYTAHTSTRNAAPQCGH
jgi:hypothetical protein